MVTLDSTVCWGGGGGNSYGYFRQHCLLGGEFSWLL